jgi:hypothetical protein
MILHRWSCTWLRDPGFSLSGAWRWQAGSLGGLRVGSPQEAATAQIKVRPPKHLAFQPLQTLAMAFDGAIAPFLLQGRRNGGLILPETGGKTLHLAHGTLLHGFPPCQ